MLGSQDDQHCSRAPVWLDCISHFYGETTHGELQHCAKQRGQRTMLKLRPLSFYERKSPAILWALGKQLNEVSGSGEFNWASLIIVFNDQKVNLMSNIEINPPASIQLITLSVSVVVSIKMNWDSHSVFHYMFFHNLYSEVTALSFLSPLPQWIMVLALPADWVSGTSNVWKQGTPQRKISTFSICVDFFSL